MINNNTGLHLEHSNIKSSSNILISPCEKKTDSKKVILKNKKSNNKYTVYHRKRESKLSKTNVKEYNNRSPHKNNTNILKIDDNDKDKEKTNNLSHEQ